MARQIHFRGRKIQAGIDRLTLPDGTTVDCDVVIHPGAVAILPLLENDCICLLNNHRPVMGEVLLEIPAGTLEQNEKPADAAVRELAEETGYRAEEWFKLGQVYPSPGVLSEITHIFVAQKLTPGSLNLERGEKIEPIILNWSEVLTRATNGTIRDAKTLLALFWWDRIRNKTSGNN